jgi:hypothetical protein
MQVAIGAKRFRLVVYIVVAAILTAVALIWFVTARSGESRETYPEWPAFEMTYEQSGHFGGLDLPASTVTTKLVYNSRSSWSQEVLGNELDPRTVGTLSTFNGESLTIDDPNVAEPIVREVEEPGEVVAPDRWFVPGADELLVDNRGFELVSEDVETDRKTISRTEAIPCVGDADSVGMTEPDSCATEKEWVSTDTIVYRTDVFPAVPVEIITESNGEEVSRLVVTDFVLIASE